MKKMLNKMKIQFIKFKWHIIIISFTLLIAVAYFTVLDKGRRDKVIEGILDTALDKKAEIVKASIEASEMKIEDYEKRMDAVDNRLKNLREKKRQTEEDSSTMTLREISDAFEDLGY